MFIRAHTYNASRKGCGEQCKAPPPKDPDKGGSHGASSSGLASRLLLGTVIKGADSGLLPICFCLLINNPGPYELKFIWYVWMAELPPFCCPIPNGSPPYNRLAFAMWPPPSPPSRWHLTGHCQWTTCTRHLTALDKHGCSCAQ